MRLAILLVSLSLALATVGPLSAEEPIPGELPPGARDLRGGGVGGDPRGRRNHQALSGQVRTIVA